MESRGIMPRTVERAQSYLFRLWDCPNLAWAVRLNGNYKCALRRYAKTHKQGFVPDTTIREILTPIYERDHRWREQHSGPDYTPTPRTPKADVAVQMTDKRDEVLSFDRCPEIFGDEVTFKFNGFLFNIQKLK